MPLKKANICSLCGIHRTQHSSGICSRCRRKPLPETPCQLCGERKTNHPCGYCYHCRNLVPAAEERLAAAIGTQRTILSVLELRQNQKSFTEIAETVGKSKSAVYSIYRRALQLPDLAIPIEIDF